MIIKLSILQKRATVNPEDKVILGALHQIGHRDVIAVRKGKYLEFHVDDSLPAADRKREFENLCRDVKMNLVNPVMEEFTVDVLDSPFL